LPAAQDRGALVQATRDDGAAGDDFSSLDLSGAVISQFVLDRTAGMLTVQATVFLPGGRGAGGPRAILLWSDVGRFEACRAGTGERTDTSGVGDGGQRVRSARFAPPSRYVLAMEGGDEVLIEAGAFAICSV
jgi:hypothetical protein